MKGILLTWNPNVWSWDNLEEEIKILQKNDYVDQNWDCYNSNVKPGDVFFIMALGGSKKKGLFGFGIVEDFLLDQESLVNKDKITNRIIGKLYILLNPKINEIIELSYLKEHFPEQKWTPQNCGIMIKNEYVNILIESWKEILNKNIAFKEKANSKIFLEGNPQQKLYTYYERDPKARDICLKKKGYTCTVCEINMADKYGDVGNEFIHVHHINFLASIKKEHILDPELDLVPVCPNCHSMLHKEYKNNYLTIEELKKIVKSNSNFA